MAPLNKHHRLARLLCNSVRNIDFAADFIETALPGSAIRVNMDYAYATVMEECKKSAAFSFFVSGVSFSCYYL